MEKEEIVSQLQNYQQRLQSLLIQKEGLSLQLLEIKKALEELNATKEKNAYKISGNIMVLKSTEDLKKELQENKEAIEIRIKSIERSEEKIVKEMKNLQEKIK